MKINITNYEEYFLLYADKELSQEDRREVEQFVQSNPSFKEELTLICETILLPEQQIFPDKSSLIKHPETIAVNDYHELMNLYIDNELNGIEKLKAEKSFNEHVSLKKEIELMKSATFQPDFSIEFPSKQSLYRYEVKVIPFIWKRLAAAAIIIGFGIWFTNQYQHPEAKNNMVSVKNSATHPSAFKPIQSPAAAPATVKQTTNEQQLAYKTPNESVSSKTNTVKHELITDKIKKAPEFATPVNTIAVVADNSSKKLTNDLPVPDINYTSPSAKTKDIATVATSDVNPENLLAVENKTVTNPSSFKSVPVSYIVQDENNDDANGSLAEQRFQKSKLGSFLKKATRTIKRNLIADRRHEN